MDKVTTFQPDGLDNSTQEFLKEAAAQIRQSMGRTAQGIVEIGAQLIAVKAKLSHGQFGAWLDQEFEMSQETAQRFMRVADRFKTVNVTDLSVATSTLYLLASGDTPKEAVKEVIERSKEGERITGAKAKEIIEQHRPTPKPEPAAPQTWHDQWKAAKERDPQTVRFCVVGEFNWLVFGEDALRVSRIVGAALQSVSLPGGEGTIAALKLENLSTDLNFKPDWYLPLHKALDGNLAEDIYADDGSWYALSTSLPYAHSAVPQPFIDPTPAPVDTAPPDGMIASMTGDGYIKPYIPEPKPETAAPFYASSSSNGGTDKWFTPADLMERVRRVLGPVALDPASCEEANAVVQATRYFTEDSDGLKQKWVAPNIYLNPPFGSVEKFIPKMYEEFCDGNFEKGVLLLPARTDTQWFKLLREFPQCYLHGRVKFLGEADKGNTAPFPSVVIGVGVDAAALHAAFGDIGDVVVPYTPAAASKPEPQPGSNDLPGLLAEAVNHLRMAIAAAKSAAAQPDFTPEEKAVAGYMQGQTGVVVKIIADNFEKLLNRPHVLAELDARLAHVTTDEERRTLVAEASALKVMSVTADKTIYDFIDRVFPPKKKASVPDEQTAIDMDTEYDDFEEAA